MTLNLVITGKEVLPLGTTSKVINHCRLFPEGTEQKHNCPKPHWLGMQYVTDDDYEFAQNVAERSSSPTGSVTVSEPPSTGVTGVVGRLMKWLTGPVFRQ